MDTVRILQVVGYKKSGKTTLVKRWVKLAKSRGQRVAVIKHHGHAEPLATPDSETDSMQFLAEGANASIVSGGGAIQLQMNSEDHSFETLLELTLFSEPNLILIEGFKQLNYPKVVLLRNEKERSELNKLTQIKKYVEIESSQDELDEWFVDYLEEKS